MSKLDPHAVEINEALAAGTSQRNIAKQYGVARSTLQHWIDQQLTPEEAARALDLEILQAEVADLRSRNKKDRKQEVQFERIFREVQAAVSEAPVKYVPADISDWQEEEKPHVQTLLLSDLHAGEVVDAESVNGMNEFNWDILVRERMPNLQRSLLSFQANRPYPISELHISCLGDMVSGAHHEELAVTNEFPSAEQAYRVGMMLGQWIEELVSYYAKIIVECVPGNHARLNKERANKQVFNSFDWLAYKIAEIYLAKYVEAGSVEIINTRSGFLVSEVAGNKVLLFHGDGVPGGGAAGPWAGVNRRWTVLKKSFAETGIYLDYCAVGHFHRACWIPGIFMNGSVKGTDEYVQKNFGSGEKPCQLLLTWNPAKSRLTDVSFLNP